MKFKEFLKYVPDNTQIIFHTINNEGFSRAEICKTSYDFKNHTTTRNALEYTVLQITAKDNHLAVIAIKDEDKEKTKNEIKSISESLTL